MYKERIATSGERIAQAMKIRKMKQSELCKLADVPKSSLSLYLSGAYEPKQDRIFDMARVLNVSEAWLMGYDVPMEREKPLPQSQTLTEGEALLLELFRQVPEHQRDMVLDMIRVALKQK